MFFTNYAADGTIDDTKVNRFVRFTGDRQVGLCTAPGLEVGIITGLVDGQATVVHSGEASVVAGEALEPGDRITSNGEGKAIKGGTLTIASGAAATDALAGVVIGSTPISKVDVDTPKTSDGKLIFLPNLFPGGVTLYLCGAGDDRVAGRGAGPLFQMAHDVAGPTEMEFQFNDGIYFAGGTLTWRGGNVGDWISLEAYAPATPVVPSVAGNANLHPSGILVPAAGDGTLQVDLATAIPVPAFDDAGVKSGMWNWDDPWTGLGNITPAAVPGTGNCHLIPAVVPLARFANKMPLLGDGTMNLQLPAIKPKYMWPQWKFRAVLNNMGGIAGLKAAWMLVAARWSTL